MLKTAAKTGTAKKLRALSFPIAAKTGTAGTKSGNSDAYALSFTSSDCVGVWMGNADNSPTDITGGGLPCNVALKINEYLYQTATPDDFPRPAGIVNAKLDKTEYYASHNMILADDCAPTDCLYREIFKKEALPRVKSDKYSHPSISVPSLSYSDGKVTINFEEGAPDGYLYLIDRYDYVTHTIVYSGEYTAAFTDEDLQDGKTYLYTVTPVYHDVKGKSVLLPAVTTKNDKAELIGIQPTEPPDIVNKDWWNY
jgi:hypothetical protein